MVGLLSYLIAADRVDDKFKFAAWKLFNEARGNDVAGWLSSASGSTAESLPPPVEGVAFTSDDARAFAAANETLLAAE